MLDQEILNEYTLHLQHKDIKIILKWKDLLMYY